MLALLYDLLPGALGVAFSPLPLLGILYAPRSGRFIFVIGWFVGIASLGALAFLLSAIQPATSSSSANGSLQVAIGVLFFFLGAKQWQGRPRAGVPPTRPKWAQGMATAAPAKLFGTGMLLAAINPKNTPLIISSALEIAGAHLPGIQPWITFGAFTVLASLSVLLIALAPLLFGERSTHVLEKTEHWLDANGNIVMAVMFTYLGLGNIVSGLAFILD